MSYRFVNEDKVEYFNPYKHSLRILTLTACAFR